MDKHDIIDALKRIEENLATADSLLDDVYDEFREIDFIDIEELEDENQPYDYMRLTQENVSEKTFKKTLIQRIESDLQDTQIISDLKVFVGKLKEKIEKENEK